MKHLMNLAAANLLLSILAGTVGDGQVFAAISRSDDRPIRARNAKNERAADSAAGEVSAQRALKSDFSRRPVRVSRADALAGPGVKIGDPLPDVAGYDAAGKSFHLRNFKGHFAVLVFGCLT